MTTGESQIMVPWGIIGALVGLAFALVEYVFFGKLMRRVEMTGGSADSRRILDWVRKSQLVVFPVVGFFAGRWVGGYVGAS